MTDVNVWASSQNTLRIKGEKLIGCFWKSHKLEKKPLYVLKYAWVQNKKIKYK